MRDYPLLQPMQDRVTSDMQEGDIALFAALGLQFEFVTKIAVSGVLSCLSDDPDRHRYSLEHRLVRANAIGDWADVLTTATTGSPAHFFRPESRNIVREFVERVAKDDWRYQAVAAMSAVANSLNIEVDQLGDKATLRQFFNIATTIRNKTRGHGAPTAAQCSEACQPTMDAIGLLASNLALFQTPWAYLHRNLSGKFRTKQLLGDGSQFDYLKRTKEVNLKNGVYIFLGSPIRVPLIETDLDLSDICLPNGQYRNDKYEVLSYVTNDTRRQDGSDWGEPPDRLPRSETEGPQSLDLTGNLFGNIPPCPTS